MFGDDSPKVPTASETEAVLNSKAKERLENAYTSSSSEIHFFAAGVCSEDGSNFPDPDEVPDERDSDWAPNASEFSNLDIPEWTTAKMLAAMCIGKVSARMVDSVGKVVDDVAENPTRRHHCHCYLGKLAMKNGDH